jgi:hypothetical protein
MQIGHAPANTPAADRPFEWHSHKKVGEIATHRPWPRTHHHHREKADLPQSRAWNHLFPHSVLEGQSKKAGLGSSSKPKNCSQIVKQKRESQPFGHLKWPGAGPNELIGLRRATQSGFLANNFSRVRFHCPNFLPLHFFANPQLPPKNRSSGRNAGEIVRNTVKATPGAGWFLAEAGSMIGALTSVHIRAFCSTPPVCPPPYRYQ